LSFKTVLNFSDKINHLGRRSAPAKDAGSAFKVNKNEPLAQKKNLNLLMLILAITYQPVKQLNRASFSICQISLILALKMPFLFD
jgi:hypothetical protein